MTSGTNESSRPPEKNLSSSENSLGESFPPAAIPLIAKRPRSIAWTGGLALLCAVTLVLAGFGFLDHQSERQEHTRELHRGLTAAALQLAQSLALPLWDLDVAQINQLINSAMEGDDNIQAVLIEDRRRPGILAGSARDARWRPAAAATPPSGNGLSTASRIVTYQGSGIGSVSVWVTDRFVRQTLVLGLLRRATGILAANVVLALALWIIFRRYVLLPLREIEAYAFRVSRDERGARLPRRFFPAELENLGTSIERMVEELTRRYRELAVSKAALAEAEERYRGIFESALEGICQTDIDGTIQAANPAIARIFDYDTPRAFMEGVGNVRSLYMDTHDRDQFIACLHQDGQVRNYEMRCKRRDGETVWLSMTARLIRNEAGEPISILGMSQDATERRLAEEALRESEEKYRALIESANDAVFVHTITEDGLPGNFVEVNEAACGRLGYSREAFYRMSPLEVDDQRCQGHIPQVMEELHRDGFTVFETAHMASDGRAIPVEVSARLVDLRGRPYIFSIARDITERKQAEATLRESEAWFRALFENAPLPYQSLDESGLYLDVNRNWLETLGYEKREVLGHGFGEFLGPQCQEPFRANFSRFKEQGAIDGVEFDMIKKDGGMIRVLLNGRVQRDVQGGFLRTHCIFTDITERKRIENALRESEAQLRNQLDYILSPEVDVDALELARILETPALQPVIDAFVKLTGVSVGLVDIKGKVLVAAGWQDICTKFHRIHPQTREICVESNVQLAKPLQKGECFSYKCANNMWDVVTPVHIGGRHVANIYTGQFFYEDETIDPAVFLAQAETYGFDRDAYMAALGRVPRFSREKVTGVMDFLVRFADMVSTLGYGNLKLAKALWIQKRVEEDLRQSRDDLAENQKKLMLAMQMANLASWEYDYASDRYLFDDHFFALYATSCEREGGCGMTPEAYAREFLFPETISYIRAGIDHYGSSDAMDAPTPLEHSIRRRDGATRIMVAKCLVVRDGSGRAVKLIGANQDITERKLAEEALRESEERYRGLYLNTPVMLHSMDTEGRLVAVSNTWCEKLGYAREEVIGRKVLDFITDESKRIAREVSWPRFYATGHVEDIPYQFIAKDGRLVDVLLSANAERDGSGEIARSLAVLVDVTLRKRAEDALRESEARYRLLVETIPLGVAVISPEMRVVAMNAKMREWNPEVDQEQHPVCFRSFNDPPLEEPCVWCPVVKTLQDGRIHEGLTATPRKDGIRPFRVIACPIRDARGELTAVIEIVEDVAERLAAEEALRRSEHKYKNLLNNIPLNIIYKDRNSVFLTVNAHYARQMGLVPEACVGKTDFDFYEASLAKRYQADDQRIMAMGVAEEFDEPYCTDGREMIIHTLKMPVRDETGRIESILVIFWDVTESKRVEAAMREAEKMAAVGTLAGGVAHDFNNILGSIANLALLARRDLPPDDEARQDLEQILESANVGKDLVRQILTFCRSGKEIRRVFDPATAARKAVKLMQPTFPAGIEVRKDLAEGEYTVLADPSQFHQVVLNLCSNAVDAMRGRPGVLSVCLAPVVVEAGTPSPHPSLAPNRYVALHVGDTGPGIAPDILGRVFEPFFTSKPKGRGTGLGLAMVHGIASRHGGAVTVHSQPGQGSVFTVYFPACDLQEDFPELPAATSVRGTGRILFVDDEDILARTGQRLLEGFGYDVTVRADGAQALAAFRENPEAFDLVMTDLTMPNMDGRALAMEVLALRPDMPVILCTGHSVAFPPKDARKIGIREYIHKPVDWNRLSVTIADLLRRKG